MRRFAVSRLLSQSPEPSSLSNSNTAAAAAAAAISYDHQSICSKQNQFYSTTPLFQQNKNPCTNILRIHGQYYSSSGVPDHSKEIDEINLKFAEAREEIESAMESKETVYFDEEAECARDAVQEVLDLFNALLAKLPDKEKGALQRSMGLKIEQLKAELAQLDE